MCGCYGQLVVWPHGLEWDSCSSWTENVYKVSCIFPRGNGSPLKCWPSSADYSATYGVIWSILCASYSFYKFSKQANVYNICHVVFVIWLTDRRTPKHINKINCDVNVTKVIKLSNINSRKYHTIMHPPASLTRNSKKQDNLYFLCVFN
jgi:hypothetical protein